MKLRDVVATTRRRLGSPLIWVAMTVLASPYLVGYLRGGSAEILAHPIYWVVVALFSMGMGMGYCLLSPLPWQWTGNDKPLTPIWRGLSQSLVFNSALILVLQSLCSGILLSAGLPPFVRIRPDLFLNAALTGLIMAMVGSIIASLELSSRERTEARADADKARWLLLKGQVGPHLLYNTLNALAELIRRDPLAAERAVLDLSELFERISSHGERVVSPLREERIILERYLGVQKLTLGDKLKVEWVWDSGLDEVEVPPLLLQPLVENALKHGLAEHVRGGVVRIEGGREENGWVCFRVCNSGAPLQANKPFGVGLANLKHRITLAYGESASFALESVGEETIATLRLRPDSLRIKP